jgi:predicted nuclease with TOPRIM domain
MSEFVDLKAEMLRIRAARIEELEAENKQLRAENERLRAALEEIRDLPGEINTSNYNHDDVVRLNDAFIETYHIARAALEGRHD